MEALASCPLLKKEKYTAPLKEICPSISGLLLSFHGTFSMIKKEKVKHNITLTQHTTNVNVAVCYQIFSFRVVYLPAWHKLLQLL